MFVKGLTSTEWCWADHLLPVCVFFNVGGAGGCKEVRWLGGETRELQDQTQRQISYSVIEWAHPFKRDTKYCFTLDIDSLYVHHMLISVCGQMWCNSRTNNSFFDTTSIVIVYQWLVYYKSYTTSVFLPVVYNRWYIASEASNSSKYQGEEQWEGAHQWCHHIHHIHNQHFQTTERHSMFIGLSRKNLCNCFPFGANLNSIWHWFNYCESFTLTNVKAVRMNINNTHAAWFGSERRISVCSRP